jgi:signal transduction histidine kinase/DNA-binding NarL/FixJ family response regulator
VTVNDRADAVAPATGDELAAMPRTGPWIGIIAALLLATLLAAAFVQVRQFALLNQTVHNQDDYLITGLNQLETEYLRLREQWREHVDQPDDAALQLRYDIFVSRVTLLHTDAAQRLLAALPQSDAVVQGLEQFVQRCDVYLGTERRVALTPEAARALLLQVEPLGDAIHQLVVDASHLVAVQMTGRQQLVRDHNDIGLALTAFLSAMVLLFAVIALRQLRKLDERRRRLEGLAAALREARIQADAANEAKSAFLADISHELRTPLNGLLGMLALVRAAPHDAQAPARLAAADDSAGHLLRLLNDMLDLSKLEAGTLTLAPEPVALRALTTDAVALMQPIADAKGLGLRHEVAATLPDHALLDATRLRQVLYNLVHNAIKYTDRGEVWLRCRRAMGAEGQDLVVFDVCDAGIGIAPGAIDELFRRWRRGDDPRARRHFGTGLGLAISRNLARLMGGEIAVHSAPGAGSVFSLRCPLVPAVAQAPAAAAAEPTVAATPLRVLVAEDHPVNRQYMAALLERLGHRCELVTNGHEAVQALHAGNWDLVLMDVHMPVMDGVAATEAIRALPDPAGRTRIVALTADVFDETERRCRAAGADEVLTKPIGPDALAQLLARCAPATLAGDAPRPPVLIDRAVVASMRELLGGRKTPALYGGFFDQAGDAVQRLREAMREADVEAMRHTGHSVKGAAANLGLAALADAAAAISSDAASLPASHLALAVQRVEELVAASRAICAAEGLFDTQPSAAS